MQWYHFDPGRGKKTLRGCATNMGSKISLLVYEWSLVQIWVLVMTVFCVTQLLNCVSAPWALECGIVFFFFFFFVDQFKTLDIKY